MLRKIVNWIKCKIGLHDYILDVDIIDTRAIKKGEIIEIQCDRCCKTLEMQLDESDIKYIKKIDGLYDELDESMEEILRELYNFFKKNRNALFLGRSIFGSISRALEKANEEFDKELKAELRKEMGNRYMVDENNVEM
jgi:hypothetical protein